MAGRGAARTGCAEEEGGGGPWSGVGDRPVEGAAWAEEVVVHRWANEEETWLLEAEGPTLEVGGKTIRLGHLWGRWLLSGQHEKSDFLLGLMGGPPGPLGG